MDARKGLTGRLGAGVVVLAVVTACGSDASSRSAAVGTAASVRTATASSAEPTAAASAICAVFLQHAATIPGSTCKTTDVRVSNLDGTWVYGRAALFDAQGRQNSDSAQILMNTATHSVIGPASEGFCGSEASRNPGVAEYDVVPSAVLTALGLRPCTVVAPATRAAAVAAEAFADSWASHHSALSITPSGTGHLTYVDSARCASCAAANAPTGTAAFTLTRVGSISADGHVTASSDVSQIAVNAPVHLTLTTGTPGKILQLQISGELFQYFCNASSIGQCGA